MLGVALCSLSNCVIASTSYHVVTLSVATTSEIINLERDSYEYERARQLLACVCVLTPGSSSKKWQERIHLAAKNCNQLNEFNMYLLPHLCDAQYSDKVVSELNGVPTMADSSDKSLARMIFTAAAMSTFE